MKIKVNRLLLCIILFGTFIKQLYSYIGIEYILIPGSSYGYQQLARGDKITLAFELIVLISIVLLFFIESKVRKKFFTLGYRLTLLALVLGIMFWEILTIFQNGLITTLYSTTAPHVYLTALCVCIGMDESLFNVFIKYIKWIGYLSLGLSLVWYLVFLQTHPNGLLGNSSVLTFYIQGFWFLCIWSITEKKTSSLQVLVTIGIGAFLAGLFNSRSWIIQCLIWAVVYVYYTSGKKGLTRLFKVIVFVSLGLVIAYFLINHYYPQSLDLLIKKMGTDTRSFQYEDLFSQTNLWDYIFGNGYNFQYYSASMGGMYSYIDNSYLLMLVRYGLVLGLFYPLVFVIPIIKTFKNRSIRNKTALILLMWLAALGGLSVYCAVILDLKSIALAALAGYSMRENKKSLSGKKMYCQIK
ncbi:hypothetical protein [Fumia xinanensis]|uniref:Uncharacterized protein n=1 Tax=Fumia xinanensis TaxID=2763659 RepID=A0A926E1V0_9FIRM|nr:hypothetical protein [Fumia xinanensis]MBC8560074.1 hypothetical protein [Fumia xinanensis]